MLIPLRSALTAGVAALSVSAITFTSTVSPIPHRSVVVSSSAAASHAPVDLLAASQRLFQQRDLPAILSLSTAQLLEAAQTRAAMVTPTLAPSPPLIALADAVDAIYSAIEPWVRYTLEWVSFAVFWIPWVGWIIDDQITVLYNFGENLVNSAVFNTTDWLRGQGSALKNIADWVVDFGLAVVWLGLDEINNWIPLPPAWYPPDPPVADVPEGVFGDLAVGAADALAGVSNGIWNIWEPVKSGIGTGVGAVGNILDAISFIPFVPIVNFQIQEGWNLIAGEGDALTGFAHDMINAGNQWVKDAVNGDGLIAATINAAVTTWNSIGARIGQAVQALVDWGAAQIEHLFGIGYGKSGLLTEQSTADANSVGITKLSADTSNAKLASAGDAPAATGEKSGGSQVAVGTGGPQAAASEQQAVTGDVTVDPSVTPITADPSTTPTPSSAPRATEAVDPDTNMLSGDDEQRGANQGDAKSGDAKSGDADQQEVSGAEAEPTGDTPEGGDSASEPEPADKPAPKPDEPAAASGHTDAGEGSGSADS